jgi:hypothetical protein
MTRADFMLISDALALHFPDSERAKSLVASMDKVLTSKQETVAVAVADQLPEPLAMGELKHPLLIHECTDECVMAISDEPIFIEQRYPNSSCSAKMDSDGHVWCDRCLYSWPGTEDAPECKP